MFWPLIPTAPDSASAALMASSDRGATDFAEIDVHANAWWILAALLVGLLAIDLLRHREAHAPTPAEAARETLGWVACGLAFGVAVGVVWGGDAFGEYMSGYLIEKSLSIDNVFVWSILFSTMRIPLRFQHRVLFWGIFGALTLRLIFILVGTELVERFFWTLIVFGVFLIVTGFRILRHQDDEGDTASTAGLGLLKRVMPVSDEFDGQRFFTRLDGRLAATPLLAALVVVEATDVIFAVDSVPAVMAVSKERFIIFSSNAFAILGLRAMYFLLANAKERFHYLSHGLGAILIFVGTKMTIGHWVHIPTPLSLGVIIALLIGAVVFSEARSRRLGIATPAAGHHHDEEHTNG